MIQCSVDLWVLGSVETERRLWLYNNPVSMLWFLAKDMEIIPVVRRLFHKSSPFPDVSSFCLLIRRMSFQPLFKSCDLFLKSMLPPLGP